MKSAFHKLATQPRAAMIVLFVLPIVLRLALMPFHPVPIPAGGDDFSYLLLGDTLAHFRLANATHPMHRFFEADFVLQEPTYSSIFPLGQGLVLALGQLIFGSPWTGVLAMQSLLCALCYWMLRGWTTPSWALVGGLLAVMQFGPLNQWTNSYFGGGVSAIAGCLVFGALPRLFRNRDWHQQYQMRNALLLGVGFGLQILTRPFESILLLVSVLAYLSPALRGLDSRKRLGYLASRAALPALAALGVTLLHNHAVTGDWLKLPYLESRDQYGVPTTFTFQSIPTPHRELTRQQELDYRAQSVIHGEGPDTLGRFAERLIERLQHYPFFVPWPLYPALATFTWALFRRREWEWTWAACVILFFALGTNFYPYFYPHYIAALACLFLLVSILGLQQLRRVPFATPALLALCGAQFLFWYGLHLSANEQLIVRFARYQSPYFISWGDPEGRLGVQKKLTESPGKDLVFVRFSGKPLFREWIYNGVDIDSAQIVWARDLGVAANFSLQKYYPDRIRWLLEPDAVPPRLNPYRGFDEQESLTFVPSTTPRPSSESVSSGKPQASHARQPASASPQPSESVPELPDSGWLIEKPTGKKK